MLQQVLNVKVQIEVLLLQIVNVIQGMSMSMEQMKLIAKLVLLPVKLVKIVKPNATLVLMVII